MIFKNIKRLTRNTKPNTVSEKISLEANNETADSILVALNTNVRYVFASSLFYCWSVL